MKQKIKNSHFIRGTFFAGLIAVSLSSTAQRAAVKADPELGKITLADKAGFAINENFIQAADVISMKIPVMNSNHGQAIPAGSCKIKIGLGSKLQLDPSFDLATAGLSSYFKWSSAVNDGQVQLTGDLISALPANIKEVNVAFKIKGAEIGSSTITANFLISNHNTRAILSDENGANNMSYLPYAVSSKAAPATTASIDGISKEGCSLNVSFSADKEVNLARFEVEASKDGVSFEKVSTVSAANTLSYKTSFDLSAAFQVQLIYVRVKAIETSGRILYSGVKSSNGFCGTARLVLGVYPNPSTGFAPVVIKASQGLLDGKFQVKMMDVTGKSVLLKQFTLNNAPNFQLDVNKVAAGKYFIQVNKHDGTQIGLLKFEKM